MIPDITILTSIHINSEYRLKYFKQTIESFYDNCVYSKPLIHNIIDDRSSNEFKSDIYTLCEKYEIELIEEVQKDKILFSDVMKSLINSVDTEYYLYLEPDFHFYLRSNFIEPIIRLYELVPDLYQVYLRHGIHNNRGKNKTFSKLILSGDNLITPDNSYLNRIVIDDNNTGWVGYGEGHETYSNQPSIYKTSTVKPYFTDESINLNTPADFESFFAKKWKKQKKVGYLNGQSFCYHIGKYGGISNKSYSAIDIGDEEYEKTYSLKFV